MKRVLTWMVAAVLVLVIIELGFFHLSPDYDIYFVRSESMRPTINMGDVVVVGSAGGFLSGGIEPGRIITFKLGKGEVTHRVISVNGDTLITKGDALEDPDPRPVSLSQVKGIVLFKVPYLGYLISFARTKNGWFLTIILPAMVLVALIVKDIVKEALTSD